MATQYRVAVAHYGVPALKVKHWAIIVMLDDNTGLVHQITGSSTTYTMKPLETVTLIDLSTYLGKVDVGSVHKDHVSAFSQSIAGGNIVLHNLGWNCQNWVVERLCDLRECQGVGHAWNINNVSHEWLLDELSKSQRV